MRSRRDTDDDETICLFLWTPSSPSAAAAPSKGSQPYRVDRITGFFVLINDLLSAANCLPCPCLLVSVCKKKGFMLSFFNALFSVRKMVKQKGILIRWGNFLLGWAFFLFWQKYSFLYKHVHFSEIISFLQRNLWL